MDRDDESLDSFQRDEYPLVRERSMEEVTAGFENWTGNGPVQTATVKTNQPIVKLPEKRNWNSVTMYTLSHK